MELGRTNFITQMCRASPEKVSFNMCSTYYIYIFKHDSLYYISMFKDVTL